MDYAGLDFFSNLLMALTVCLGAVSVDAAVRCFEKKRERRQRISAYFRGEIRLHAAMEETDGLSGEETQELNRISGIRTTEALISLFLFVLVSAVPCHAHGLPGGAEHSSGRNPEGDPAVQEVPSASLAFQEQNGNIRIEEGIACFSAPQDALLTVSCGNDAFDEHAAAAALAVTAAGCDGNEIRDAWSMDAWQETGSANSRQVLLHFTEDALYTVRFSYTDAAGQTCQTVDTGEPGMPLIFLVDTKKPEGNLRVACYGEDHHAEPDVITFSDLSGEPADLTDLSERNESRLSGQVCTGRKIEITGSSADQGGTCAIMIRWDEAASGESGAGGFLSENELRSCTDWRPLGGGIMLGGNFRKVIYARIQDRAGNETYIRTPVLESEAEEIKETGAADSRSDASAASRRAAEQTADRKTDAAESPDETEEADRSIPADARGTSGGQARRYVMSAETAKMNRSYVMDPCDAVMTVTGDKKLVSHQAVLYRNGDERTLEPGKDYELTEEDDSAGRKFTYTVYRKCFAEDGVYRLIFTDIDEDGRAFSNDDDIDTTLNFGTDTAAPVLEIHGLKENGVYTDSVKTVTVRADDNMKLSAVRIYLDSDDKPAAEWNEKEAEKVLADGGDFSIRIPGTEETAHSLRAEAYDVAGGKTEACVETFFVKESGLHHFLGSGQWKFLLALLAAAAAVIAVAVRRSGRPDGGEQKEESGNQRGKKTAYRGSRTQRTEEKEEMKKETKRETKGERGQKQGRRNKIRESRSRDRCGIVCEIQKRLCSKE